MSTSNFPVLLHNLFDQSVLFVVFFVMYGTKFLTVMYNLDAVQSLGDIPDSDDLPEVDQLEEEGFADTDSRPLYRAQTREDLLDEDSAGDSSDRVRNNFFVSNIKCSELFAFQIGF